ncbi:SDR family NAD(P)-dependent oxidoreductase [Streptomyces klenkii]|uniref:SDR family NAD(P)-dependent oxidoreductase n=1 Tax=Streptomyces klenkii TaxID=1420899 RepID=UPI001319C4CD
MKFSADGAQLAVVARRTERLRRLAEELAAGAAGPPVVIAADLSEPGGAAQATERLGAVDVLVNNAGAPSAACSPNWPILWWAEHPAGLPFHSSSSSRANTQRHRTFARRRFRRDVELRNVGQQNVVFGRTASRVPDRVHGFAEHIAAPSSITPRPTRRRSESAGLEAHVRCRDPHERRDRRAMTRSDRVVSADRAARCRRSCGERPSPG